MAPLTVDVSSAQATSVAAQGRLNPDAMGGRVRYAQGYYLNSSGSALATNSIIQMITALPACRILGTSYIAFSAHATSPTISVGWQEYKPDDNGTVVASSIAGLLSDVSTASASTQTINGDAVSGYEQGFSLTGQADILAQVTAGNIPNNGWLALHLFYVVD